MRARWWLVLAWWVAGSGCKQVFGREPIVRQLVAGCEAGAKRGQHDLKGANCDCVMRSATADFSSDELALLVSEENLFDDGEMETLLMRRATQCLKPMAIAGCAKQPGTAQCVCLMTRLFDEFEGDAIVDVVERIQQGRPLPPEFATINRDCARGGSR